MRKLNCITLIGVLSLLFSTSCSSQDSSEIREIRYGSQFGMCEGYCYSEMIFTEELERNTSKAFMDTTLYPTKIETAEMKDTKWNNLTSSLTLQNFFELDSVIGCPNCDDGGESWVEIKTIDKSYRVSFEFGSVPQPIENLIEEIKIKWVRLEIF